MNLATDSDRQKTPLSPNETGNLSIEIHISEGRRVFREKVQKIYIFPDWAWICKHFKEPRNWFPAWPAGTTALFDAPARQAMLACGIDSLGSITGLLEGFQIRNLAINYQE
jgi:hypothetical protein